ncbi:dsRBD fold-containing protein [Nonomuraea longicatena]|uniref:DUF1876 domain-containing protein n=1 Tax=Nonomuraea longicatena TaxID=83682 RepID=A0ABN1P3S3_9ACTN
MHTKQWTVQVIINEDDEGRTSARAVLSAPGSRWHESEGVARRHPDDMSIPEIGDELAAGRALMALAQELLSDAASDVAMGGAGQWAGRV